MNHHCYDDKSIRNTKLSGCVEYVITKKNSEGEGEGRERLTPGGKKKAKSCRDSLNNETSSSEGKDVEKKQNCQPGRKPLSTLEQGGATETKRGKRVGEKRRMRSKLNLERKRGAFFHQWGGTEGRKISEMRWTKGDIKILKRNSSRKSYRGTGIYRSQPKIEKKTQIVD